MERRILHLDIDAFLASVEQLRDPALQGHPVAVGTGVVASRSYEAKARGVTTAMPIREARRRCPELIVRAGDSRLAERYRRQVVEVVRQFSPVVEATSLDDLYADLTGLPGLTAGAVPFCERLRGAVRAATGLSVAQGVGGSRVVARLATARAKPGGIREVPHGGERDFLGAIEVGELPGIGPRGRDLLQQVGIARLEQLWQVDRELLRQTFGARGEQIYWRCRGLDDDPVRAAPIAQSISRESSLEPGEDAAQQRPFLRAMLSYLVDRAATELRRQARGCRTVETRLGHVDGGHAERRRSLPGASECTDVLFAVAAELLDELLQGRRVLVRRIGVCLAGLEGRRPLQGDLFAVDPGRGNRLFAAVDALRTKHGFGAVLVGESAGLLGRLPRGPHGFRLRTPSLTL